MTFTQQLILAAVVGLPSTLSAVASIIAARYSQHNLRVSKSNSEVVNAIKDTQNATKSE